MAGFREVPTEVSFPALEREVLERWEREGTFQRSIDQREGKREGKREGEREGEREGGREYVFYDGPPFATGLPHYGHILTSYIKDVVPRYFTMRGYHVPRRWGWDCHGLPVELELEKELGFSSRAQILAHGIGPFNEACRASVLRYADEWRRIIGRLGRWVDFDRDYKTMDQGYMESVVWVFRSLHDKGLIYEGDKVVAFCTRCQTTLSNFEARLDDAFRPRQDPAITVRFRTAEGDLLAWTTTPWTLPSNVALAVGADVTYVRYDRGDDRVWIAEARAAAYAKELAGYQPAATRPGRELVGLNYQPLLPYFADIPNAFRVLAGDFVTIDDGTGIVHLAPAFGEDDHALCTQHGIAGPNPVGDDGAFDARVTDFAGQHVFEANGPIARKLVEQGSVVRRETCDHNYPHCWRCDQPLIYRAIRTWFLRVTAIKQQMLAANQQIRWIPEHIRDGRFGNWLENARDWAISRNRFWGAPIPVWRCDGCGALDVIGSKAELEQKSGCQVADWHRPAIDDPAWPCTACSGTRRRVADVLDCWFESGSMPYAQVHYPFEHKAGFEATFPGDFIVEYIAQTRGWFYTLVVLAAALFDKPPFKDVVCHGVILAADGRKMSKRLKNYPDPMALVEQHGSDALRIALLSSAAVRGTDLRFSEDAVRDAVRRFCLPVWNALHYFTAYARIDDFVPTGALPAPTRLDRYLLSETESLRAAVDAHMARYDFAACYDAIEDYIVLVSTWYIRLSKQRLWREGQGDDKRTAYEVLYAALSMLARVMAPFAPFLAERVHEALGGDRSVHLEDWPAARPEWLAPELAAEMAVVRRVVRLARSIREDHGIKHRHPLRSVAISGLPVAAVEHNREILAEELNVKDVRSLTEAEAHTVARRVPKLDYGKVGKRLRGEVKAVQAAIDIGAYELAGDALIAAGHRIEPGEYQLRYLVTEGLGVAAEEGVIAVLDLTSDPALVEEGLMRDLNRGLQDLRKGARLPYDRRVVVSVVAPPAFQRIVAAHRDWLAEQVLASEIISEPIAQPLATGHIEVGDEPIAIALG
jgi:isoleucyl-tRNA synthetase